MALVRDIVRSLDAMTNDSGNRYEIEMYESVFAPTNTLTITANNEKPVVKLKIFEVMSFC